MPRPTQFVHSRLWPSQNICPVQAFAIGIVADTNSRHSAAYSGQLVAHFTHSNPVFNFFQIGPLLREVRQRTEARFCPNLSHNASFKGKKLNIFWGEEPPDPPRRQTPQALHFRLHFCSLRCSKSLTFTLQPNTGLLGSPQRARPPSSRSHYCAAPLSQSCDCLSKVPIVLCAIATRPDQDEIKLIKLFKINTPESACFI